MAKLIEQTPDPKAKFDLQQQMLHLREVAEVNLQIAAYNEAASAANRGDVKKALAMVDRLLETATDAAVLKDAIALKKQLEKRVKGMRRF